MPEETRLRIVSDGSPRGTRVETEGGTLVKGVQAVSWKLDLDGLARVQVELLGVAANVMGLVENESSFVEDPEAIPQLAVPQDPPSSEEL